MSYLRTVSGLNLLANSVTLKCKLWGSLQPLDILWIHWRVYNFTANTSKRVLFLPPSDAYVRSFLYLLYTLIKLYYTKALSDQASSLAPDWILLLWGPRIPVSSRESTTTFTSMEKKLSTATQEFQFLPFLSPFSLPNNSVHSRAQSQCIIHSEHPVSLPCFADSFALQNTEESWVQNI